MKKEKVYSNGKRVKLLYIYMANYQVIKVELSDEGAISLGIVGFLRIYGLSDLLK